MRSNMTVALVTALLACSTESALAGPGPAAANDEQSSSVPPNECQKQASASDALRECHKQLTTLLKASKRDKAKVSASIDALLDYRTLAERSLGRHWAERSEAERQEFTTVLATLVRTSYRKNIAKTLDYDVTYLGEDSADGATLVKSRAKHRTNKRDEPVSIHYVARRVGKHWLVVDIVTDGSSLVRNYQSQFQRIIKKDGFAELMRKLQRKLKNEGE